MRRYGKHKESGWDTHISRQVFPQAPSPTMTSLRRISAMLMAKRVSFEAFWNNCVVGRSSVACRDDTGGRRWLMRIEEGSLMERLNQKRERRLSIIVAFRIFSLFTGCLQTCDYHLLYVLICWSYQATPACVGLKPLKYITTFYVLFTALGCRHKASPALGFQLDKVSFVYCSLPTLVYPSPPQPCPQLMPVNTKICLYMPTLIPVPYILHLHKAIAMIIISNHALTRKPSSHLLLSSYLSRNEAERHQVGLS